MDELRQQLIELVEGVGAHMPFESAVADFPPDAINRRAPNVDYTPWHLLEHLRLTQDDILRYIQDREYEEMSWPDDYWPARDATATPEQFAATIQGFMADQATLRRLAETADLLAPIPNTPGHTILRELRIVADHNAYHIGEFAILRQVMGTWPPEHED